MSGFADAYGYGTDPAGDAARREAEGVVELPDGTRVAGIPAPALPALPPGTDLAGSIRRTAHLVPPSPAEVIEVLGDKVVGKLLDPHALTRTEYRWGIAVVCACGLWECAVTGPSSAAWAERDYAEHRRKLGA